MENEHLDPVRGQCNGHPALIFGGLLNDHDVYVSAFDFYSGIQQKILLYNLKAGMVRPDLYDPNINRTYAELEYKYGFVPDPAKVATPQHKGKVDRQMPELHQQLIAGRSYYSVPTRYVGKAPWVRSTR